MKKEKRDPYAGIPREEDVWHARMTFDEYYEKIYRDIHVRRWLVGIAEEGKKLRRSLGPAID
jgi:hypothetical protein